MTDTIEALLARDEAELYEALGRDAGRGFTPAELTRAGKEIFANCLEAATDAVCRSEKVRSLHQMAAGDGAEVASAVLDCLIGVLHGVPLATIAVLIVKRGLPRLCQVHWRAQE